MRANKNFLDIKMAKTAAPKRGGKVEKRRAKKGKSFTQLNSNLSELLS